MLAVIKRVSRVVFKSFLWHLDKKERISYNSISQPETCSPHIARPEQRYTFKCQLTNCICQINIWLDSFSAALWDFSLLSSREQWKLLRSLPPFVWNFIQHTEGKIMPQKFMWKCFLMPRGGKTRSLLYVVNSSQFYVIFGVSHNSCKC